MQLHRSRPEPRLSTFERCWLGGATGRVRSPWRSGQATRATYSRSAPPDQSARSARRARPLKRTALLAKPMNGINAHRNPTAWLTMQSAANSSPHQIPCYTSTQRRPEKLWLTLGASWIRVWWMIRPGFLSAAERGALIVVARDGLVEHRVARRANAIVLLNDGWNCEEVGSALLLDDDTVREWFGVYQRQGMAGLRNFGHEGSSCQLTDEQQTALKAFVTMRLPRSTNAIGAWLRKNYELSYSHSGLIALLHRLGFVYHKPQRVPRKLDEAQQRAFIASYEKLLNRLEPDESVVFVDAVHPTHQARPAGCWAPKDVAIGIEQTTGRQRLNIHGAINLETGQTQMLEAPKIDAMSLIALLVAIEAAYSGKKWIHVFLDNATYHHATLVREWLGQPGRRIRLYFIPSYCPHLDPIERCWGVMHEHVTNNRSYETFAQFRSAILRFLRRTVTKKWDRFRDRITDNFRIISPDEFRVVA